jgi:thiol-disulfide isomerase/thioredoxin
MHAMTRNLLRSTALALLAGVALFAPMQSLEAAAAAARGPAPDFTLPLRGGKEMKLSQYRGQVVMLNFWASWCGPCRQEMPLLESIQKKYKPLGFTLVGINVEPDSAEAEKFLKQTPVSFPVAFDRKSDISKLFKVKGMPSTVIVDRKGNTRVVHNGYRPGDENIYLDHIRGLLRE